MRISRVLRPVGLCLLASLALACGDGTKPPTSATRAGAGQTERPGEPAVRGDAGVSEGTGLGIGVAEVDPDAPKAKVVQPPVPAEPAPPESARVSPAPKAEDVAKKVASYFEGHVGRRLYIQVDKPLYKPGETIWLKVWDLEARSLSGEGADQGVQVQLVSPKGAVVLQKRVTEVRGEATNDLVVPEGVQGGEYILRVLAFGSYAQAERPVIVSSYEAPRVKKKLEFVRKAYGPGDEVTATIEVKRPTGEPLANHPLIAAIRLDGQDLPRVSLTTNDDGGGLVRFQLPAQIEVGDGLLTVLVEDGGVTESVSKRIPIILKKLQLSMFPEGGKLIEGVESRLYFEAKNTIGKPADVAGRIVDDHGNAVATFESYRDGLGRFAFTPSTGRRYHVEVTQPIGVTERYPVPLAEPEGCVLRSFDDLDGQEPALRVGVQCTKAQTVTVVGMLRERLIDAAAVEVPEDGQAVVYLRPEDEALARAQGAARVTVFDADLVPLAERLVYRNRRSRLGVKVEPDKEGYSPRDQVVLSVTTTDLAGEPVPADLALSVVDDTVISYADDKTGHLLSRLLLEPELPDGLTDAGRLEEPNFYMDLTEDKSALALDLLMGTRGYRRFEWQPVLDPQPVVETSSAPMGTGAAAVGRANLARKAREVGVLKMLEAQEDGGLAVDEGGEGLNEAVAMAVAEAEPAPEPERAEAEEMEPKEKRKMRAAPPAARPVGRVGGPVRLLDNADMDRAAAQDPAPAGDDDWKAVMANNEQQAEPWAVVRVFPAPVYSADYAGPRTDFRETVHWAPEVRTGKDGKATVSFYLSDAVTSFRVLTEGVGRGLPGREETVIKSSLPFSMSVKLPLEVTAGDELLLPLTLTNERDEALDVDLQASFGELLALGAGTEVGDQTLAAGQRASRFFPVEVRGTEGKSRVSFTATAGGLQDSFEREVVVVPQGFPRSVARSGQAKGSVVEQVTLTGALGSGINASVRLYPSPVATLTSGLEGMLREPSGCFEQTSSSNYPNIMVMKYLRENQVDDPKLVAKSARLLDKGYRRLTGYESKKGGYEWFGGNPGHEALTAYGLLEFMDMRDVYGDVDRVMIDRTAAWLRGRRDGRGGFQRDPKALDSFGRASDQVTNAYIVFALTEAGITDLPAEIEVQAKLVRETTDAYLLALATNTLLNVPGREAEAEAAARKLVALQDEDGAWKKANHSITRSGGTNLQIETTALAVMALLDAGGHDSVVRKAIGWLNEHRGGYGQWGATQATVLALEAMTRYASASRRTQSSGRVTVLVNGETAGTFAYEAGHRDPIEIGDFGRYLTAGDNRVEIRTEGDDELPYSLAIDYRTLQPASSPDSVVDLTTKLERGEVKMGENVRLVATVTNRTEDGQPMTLARVGLPGGLTFQTWQLKELRDKGLIGFYETRPREVILYFRDMKPSETKTIPLDLVATVPGRYVGPASQAYLYYTDEHRTWTAGLPVRITP